jgi:hypothetical protein
MRCLYCDRSLGILRFRITEPFCSLEHRKLFYRKSDPPLANLLESRPHLADRLTAPLMEQWIPEHRANREGIWPTQRLRRPEVAPTGPVIWRTQTFTEARIPRYSIRPAPVEFSAVVYVIPPGDEGLTTADLRDRILKTSQFTATVRFTLHDHSSVTSGRVRKPAEMYGPEFPNLETTCPISVSIPERPALSSPSHLLTGLDTLRPVNISLPDGPWPIADAGVGGSMASLRPGGVPTCRLEVSPAVVRSSEALDAAAARPFEEHRSPMPVRWPSCAGTSRAKLPVQPVPSLPECSLENCVNSVIARLDPIRIAPDALIVRGAPHAAFADSCRPARSRSIPHREQFRLLYLTYSREVLPRQARLASALAPVISNPRRIAPLQKTPQDAEHLT